MRTLQGIKSPKHKSFIEFLKGELRRAKATLAKADKRKAYDAELLEDRGEQLARILDVVLADGILTEAEEVRIQQVALDVGLLAGETAKLLDAELRSRGAKRESAGAAPKAPAPKAPAPKAAPTRRRDPKPAPPVRGKKATHTDIHRAINKSLGSTARKAPAAPAKRPTLRRPTGKTSKPAKPKSPPPPVVAEYVGPPKAPKGEWGQVTKPARTTGWGKASVVKEVGVCTSCLKPVQDHELTKGKAERLADGRLHCTACTNRLVAGLICASCYQRITRADMKAKTLVHRGGRVNHEACQR
jgi:hypothetical protein